MNTRERVVNVLSNKKADRLPAVYFGFWYELLEEWEQAGIIRKGFHKEWADGNEADREIMKLLGAEYNWNTVLGAETHLFPLFEKKELGRQGGTILFQNEHGVIESIAEGASGIPGEHDYLLKDREGFNEHYKDKLVYSDKRLKLDLIKKLYSKRDKTAPIGLNLGSLFGNIRNMLTVVGMSYLILDDYDLLAEICDLYGDIAAKCADNILKWAKKEGIVFDYAHYWEDICFKNGPLISPSMFDELCGKHYKKVNDIVKGHGINIISLDCDGVTELLLPTWFENGVNVMFPIEIGTWGDQFEAARKKFGKGMLGVGGMDKTVLREDKKAVDKELERLKPLIAAGGFIPCPDHRLMPGTKIELAQYYFEQIKRVKI